ncbi:MAG: hypothetical protein A2445_03260 [Candidatus Jacksonbacteria bacterium RIFOXYC2_FULL_44_29]|nr:MAG: hypothetical protein UW45_C0042G0006 [Parcubacteria group bacterium GW2011_GWC2_44_22]OGY77087.1 MAG: hypothetical protein A2295_05100 [Candidatus Jacksonbacteria bacterium RIFOXYB2_FULL_44_15]OGY78352.1 MAG: hypothetical protein A2550_00345 [Candidatus Jacksonbacteria bacterium RIFOXYD2_FULL_43_21]OGY79817.1 MAG: hypothetical protein A2445_03260 [Candidatus Jacksonbacteria bacterium RIFOXYC2_FULL_44_29]HBH46862.1 hypothetical protein [Candidatus Jacksonbacteria bacterium]
MFKKPTNMLRLMMRFFVLALFGGVFFIAGTVQAEPISGSQPVTAASSSALFGCVAGESCADAAGSVAGVRVDPVIAKIKGERIILINTPAQFSATGSRVLGFDPAEIEYWWDFGDLSAPVAGEVVQHEYLEVGDYQVTLVIKTPRESVEEDFLVKVTDQGIVLITDSDTDPFVLTNVLNQAGRLNLLVKQLTLDKEEGDALMQEKLINFLLNQSEEIQRFNSVISWTKNNDEIDALLSFGQQPGNRSFFADKNIVIVGDNPGLIARRAQPIYDTLLPRNMLVVAPRILGAVLAGDSKGNLIRTVQNEREDFVILGIHSRRNYGQVTFFNFLSHFTNFLINRGVSVDTIFLILLLPIVATLIAFARQLVGIKALGIYIPTILTLIFVAIGLGSGLVLLLLILLTGTVARIILKRLRLLYLPRMALVITIVSVVILGMFYLSVKIPHLTFMSVSIFPILMLIMLVEEFIKVQIEEGARGALFLTLETIVLSIVSFILVSWAGTRNLLLAYPEVILLSFVINFFLGKWTGLRLWEYYRFREVLKRLPVKNKIKSKTD